MGWYLTDDKGARFAILFLMAMLTLFGFKQIGMSGGGTLAALMMGTTIHNSLAELWCCASFHPPWSFSGCVQAQPPVGGHGYIVGRPWPCRSQHHTLLHSSLVPPVGREGKAVLYGILVPQGHSPGGTGNCSPRLHHAANQEWCV